MEQPNSLEQLADDVVDYWTSAFAPYLAEEGRATFAGQRPVARIVERLLALPSYDSPQARQTVLQEVQRLTGVTPGELRKRRVIVAASESGVWASELTVVASMLLAAGYEVTVATETGEPPHMLSVSLDPKFVDGALGIPVVSPEEAELGARYATAGTAEAALLERDRLLNLGGLVRPPIVADYLKDADATMQELRAGIEKIDAIATDYDALVVTGGSGAVAGFAMNGGLHHLVLAFNRLQKPIVAECNGVFALAQAIDPATKQSVLYGRLATTHSKSHEYRRGGWGWARPDPETGKETWTSPGADGNPIIDSEPMVKNFLGPDGVFLSPPATPYAVAVDGHIITGRTTPDGGPAAAALIALLDGDGAFSGRYFIEDDGGFRPV